MIYVDTSVVLAQLLAEDRVPESGLWQAAPLVTSRLLEYEVWTRINARGLSASHGDTSAHCWLDSRSSSSCHRS